MSVVRYTAILAVVALCAACSPAHQSAAANVLIPQKGVGAKYGSADPLTCSSKNEPKDGAITADLATQYFICGFDHTNVYDNLFLAENVKLEVGGGVPASQSGLLLGGQVDPNSMVYPIRGSFDNYLCSPLDGTNNGHNCALWHETSATGHCVQTTFGDWSCNMSDLDEPQIPNQPPPAATE